MALCTSSCRCSATAAYRVCEQFYKTSLQNQLVNPFLRSLLTPVLRVKSNGYPVVKLKSEVCPGGRGNYVQQIHTFAILAKCYFVVTRSAGLVQLYEQQKAAAKSVAYKLIKEWKNSTVSARDPVVAVGSFRNQYMYTCLNEGKLVIRDLINDDADDSVKTYLIDGPVLSVHVQPLAENMRILVAAGGQDNAVKIYDLDFGLSMASNLSRLYSVGVSRPNMTTMVRLANVLPDLRLALRRNLFQNFTTYLEWRRLVPVYVAANIAADDHASGTWVLSVCFVASKVCAGTQFGDFMVYNAEQPYDHEEPEHTVHLLQFPINTLHVFANGRYILYTDTMSKAGVLDVCTFEVVNFYDYLKIGPTVASKVYTCHEAVSKLLKGGSVSRFDPVYLVSSTIDGNVLVYKLHDNNTSELKLWVSNAGIVPDLDVMELDAYSVLEGVFGMHDVQFPAKRRRQVGLAQFLQYGSGDRSADLASSSSSVDMKGGMDESLRGA